MSDLIDTANDRAMHDTARREAEIRAKAAAIPEGTEGDCEFCGEWFSRLVEGACGRCRDKYKLP